MEQITAADSQKGIIQYLVLIILFIGIIAGLYLVQTKQIFRPKAGGGGPIMFQYSSGNPLPNDPTQNLPVSNSLDVQVQLNVPDAP